MGTLMEIRAADVRVGDTIVEADARWPVVKVERREGEMLVTVTRLSGTPGEYLFWNTDTLRVRRPKEA